MPEPTTGPGKASPQDPGRGTAGEAIGSGRDGQAEVVVLADPASVSLAAARRIADTLRDAVDERGRADFSTTGGSTPLGIYPHLASAPLRDIVPWSSVHLWWGDERLVPRDHPESNVRPADELLLGAPGRSGESGGGASGSNVRAGTEPGVFVPADHLHPFPCTQAIAEGRGGDWCATRYADELRSALRIENGWPVFDLVLLGVGPDGHIFSVFPGSPAFGSRQWVVPIPPPTHVKPHLPRVTLNPAVLTVARSIIVVAHGSGKAQVLGRVFGRERNPRQLPAQLTLRPNTVWFVDEAAASGIER